MHSSTILSFVALAMTAAAVPTGFTTGGAAPTCSTSAVNKCCNGFRQDNLLGLLSNIGLGCVPIVGSTCTSGTAACCSSKNNGLVVLDVCSIGIGA